LFVGRFDASRRTNSIKGAKEAQKKAKEIEDAVYDLKAVNANKKPFIDIRTPEELLDIIEAKGREIKQSLATLKKLCNDS
jgi:type I restriction enzyme M protein